MFESLVTHFDGNETAQGRMLEVKRMTRRFDPPGNPVDLDRVLDAHPSR